MLAVDDIDSDTVLQKSKDKEFIVKVAPSISKDGETNYKVSDISLRKNKSKKASKAVEDNEQ